MDRCGYILKEPIFPQKLIFNMLTNSQYILTTKQALAMEQIRDMNLLNSVSSHNYQGKKNCCLSCLNSRYLRMLQKFLEGCRVCQHCHLSVMLKHLSSSSPSLWLKDWAKSRSVNSMPFLAIGNGNDKQFCVPWGNPSPPLALLPCRSCRKVGICAGSCLHCRSVFHIWK